MKRAALIFVMTLAVALQVSFVPGLRPFGVVPNLVLIVLVLSAVMVVTSEALIAAAVSGLLLDLVSGANFGLWTGVLMLTALVVGVMRRAGIELDGFIVAVGLVAAATIVMAVVIWLTFAPHAVRWFAAEAAGRLLVELVVNLSLTLLLRAPIRWMFGGGRLAADMGA
ncbi:MAG: hypothetical protein NVSMB39_1310 [Candidatus Saccharimonadales bacterium]